jgi:hypothetical protein
MNKLKLVVSRSKHKKSKQRNSTFNKKDLVFFRENPQRDQAKGTFSVFLKVKREASYRKA